METLTQILVNFGTIFHKGIFFLTPYAKNLVMTMAIMDTVLSHLKQLEDGNHIQILTWNVIKYGFYYFLIDYYDFIVLNILEGFVKVGLVAGGGIVTVNEFTDPSYIIALGHALCKPIMHVTQNASFMGPSPLQSNLSMMELGTELSFVIIAIQVFITYLEFYILGALAIVFLPFGANVHTRFLADKVIPAIMGAGAKLMVMAFILSATIPYLVRSQAKSQAITGPDINSAQSIEMLATSLAIAFLCWQAPAMAMSLMSATGTSSSAESGHKAKQGMSDGVNALGTRGTGLKDTMNNTGTSNPLKPGAPSPLAKSAGSLGNVE